MKFKLREIDKRMQKVGGRLHCSLLDVDHDHEFSENDEEDDNFSSSMSED
jgi:hypothetical protein